jgi:hypothetical protein
VREGDKFRFGDYAVNVLKVAPDFVSPSRNAKGEARIAIEWVGEGSPRASPGESKAASWIGSTHELVRGGQVEVRGLIARLVRIKENDPNDPGDDSIELSLVTDTQSKQLTLREFDTVFIEDFEITAHEVVPLHPMHAELPYPVEKGEGSVRLSIRRLTPPAPAGRPIG